MKKSPVLLFDIGGVLVNWDGIAPLIALTHLQLSAEQARKFWLDSPWVRQFEAGYTTPAEFARGVISELQLDLGPEEFLEAFISWDRGPLPGAVELLAELAPKYYLACLSNNNELHWRRLQGCPNFLQRFQAAFVSFELHMVKPDPEIFEAVIARLKVAPGEIIFFDDNIECVEAGRRCGLRAYQTKGVARVRAVLNELGL